MRNVALATHEGDVEALARHTFVAVFGAASRSLSSSTKTVGSGKPRSPTGASSMSSLRRSGSCHLLPFGVSGSARYKGPPPAASAPAASTPASSAASSPSSSSAAASAAAPGAERLLLLLPLAVVLPLLRRRIHRLGSQRRRFLLGGLGPEALRERDAAVRGNGCGGACLVFFFCKRKGR